MERKYKCCYGVSSYVKYSKNHVFMMDFDNVSFYTVVDQLKFIQSHYNLSEIYVIKSNNGFNAISLDKININVIYEIGINNIYTCRDFVLYGIDRGYYVLRFDHDKKLEKILFPRKIDQLKSIKFDKSNSHRKFLNFFFDININKDRYFDNNTKFDVVQYPSDKDGYHEVDIDKHINYDELVSFMNGELNDK